MAQLLPDRRVVTNELMDSLTIDEAAHLEALDGLRRINRISLTAQHLLRPIRDLLQRTSVKHLSLLDVACGGGDVAIRVAQELQRPKRGGRAGIRVDLTLLDRSPTALRQAAASAARGGVACRCIEADVLTLPECPPVDIVICSLFLHHLRKAQDVRSLLEHMRSWARHMVVISDLRRSHLGFIAAWIGCHALSRSSIVHFDGPASVRAAWTRGELSELAAQANMSGARIDRCWPWRMQLVWVPPAEVRHDNH